MPIHGLEKSARVYCSGTAGCRNAVEVTVKLSDAELAQQIDGYDGAREEVTAFYPSGYGGDWQAMNLNWVGRDGERDVFQGRFLLGPPGWNHGERAVEQRTLDAVMSDGVAIAVHGSNAQSGRSWFVWTQNQGDNVKP